jgi:hypothetical protein
MSPVRRRISLRLSVTLLCGSALALLIYACGSERSQVTEPALLGARAAAARVSLTVVGTGSTAGGIVVSDKKGISCTISVSAGAVSTAGKCSQSYKTGTTVSLTGTPANGGVISSWSGCNGAAENPNTCSVKLDGPMTVGVVFGPAATSFPLSVAGGSGGSGKVTSAPTGISCTVTAGTAGTTGCSSSFGVGASVTLSAVASSGNYLKAWAGAGCDVAGTGVGAASGSCVVKMSAAQNVVVSFDVSAPNAATGQWAAPITWPNIAINASLLPDGRVLTWGTTVRLPALWTPPASGGTTGTFVSIPEPVDLFCSGLTFLADGRLFIAGGGMGVSNQGILASTIFNFASSSFTTGPNMANGRWYPSNTTLPNGEILALSGGDTAQVTNLIPEVYQANGQWRELSTASLYLPYYPRAFVTPSGGVFVAGPSYSTYYLDPSGTGKWSLGQPSHFGDRDYGSAVMYDAGKIFIVGGGGPTATAEVIDLNAGTGWRFVAPMAVARRQSNATILADGKVLVTGGTNVTGFNTAPTSDAVLAAELWDPVTEKWTTLAKMSHYRLYHSTALLLQDGRVLSAGSGSPAATGLTDDFTAEIFSPPYLFNTNGTLATRPTITAAPTTATYAQSFTVQTPTAASISKVMWISIGAVTHSYNENQHAMPLAFSVAGASAITVTAPARAALAPPGYYLLFIIDSHGVPSIGKFVRIG